MVTLVQSILRCFVDIGVCVVDINANGEQHIQLRDVLMII